MKMKMKFVFCIGIALLLLQLLASFPATSSRLLPSNHHISQQPAAGTGLSTEIAHSHTHAPYTSLQGKGGEETEKIGSMPPNCKGKCDGCYPCMAMPTVTSHLGIQFTNYEPESWRCKCGPSFYSP